MISKTSYLQTEEVIARLGGKSGLHERAKKLIRLWMDAPHRRAWTPLVRQALTEVTLRTTQREAGEEFGTSASDVCKFLTDKITWPLEKLVLYGLQTDTSLPIDQSAGSTQHAARVVIKQLFEAMRTTRRQAGECVRLRIDEAVLDLLRELAEALPGIAEAAVCVIHRDRLAEQRLVFEARMELAQSTLRRWGQDVSAEELARAVHDLASLCDTVKIALPRNMDLLVEQFAIEKLRADFRGSCLQHAEDLRESEKQFRELINLLYEKKQIHPRNRFPDDEQVCVPRRYRINGRPPTPDEPDRNLYAAAAEFIEYCRQNRVVVSCGAYKPGCFAVFKSLQDRYGLELTILYQDVIGRDQVLRLVNEDEVDFLIAPHGPFLMLGDGHALDYRRVTSIHTFEQEVIVKKGVAGLGRKKLLVMANASPEEQWLTLRAIPNTFTPVMVETIEELRARIRNDLEPGDGIVAWEPFRSGLLLDPSLTESEEPYRVWQALFCHRRWREGVLSRLKEQMKMLFLSEWLFCVDNPAWAERCLLGHPDFLFHFGIGAGLF